MDPISGFVTAAVGDVAFNFGKGMVSAFLEARRKSRQVGNDRTVQPQLDMLVRSHGQYEPLFVPTGTVPAVDRLVGLPQASPAPLLTVEFMPGDTGAEARLTANDPVLLTISDVSHPEFDGLVLTTTLGDAAPAQLPPGYYNVSAVVIDDSEDVLLGYGAQDNLRLVSGDDLILSLAIRTDGVADVAAALASGPQPVLMGPAGDVVPILDLVLIGRAPDCDLILEHPEVSRHHADLLRIDEVSYELRDLGSTNGTYVNGVRVHSRLVGDGDQICLGSFPLNLYLA
ncbi:FHA domain-containing protein [Kribbella sp. NPDC002412]